SAFAERAPGGYFVDFNWKGAELARYGMTIDDAQMVVMSAIGGDTVTTTVEGRERDSVNVRYFRDYRSDIGRIRRGVETGDGWANADPGQPARRCETGKRPGHAPGRKRHAQSDMYTSTSRVVISAATSPRPSASSRRRSRCPPAIRSGGAASTKPWSACVSG